MAIPTAMNSGNDWAGLDYHSVRDAMLTIRRALASVGGARPTEAMVAALRQQRWCMTSPNPPVGKYGSAVGSSAHIGIEAAFGRSVAFQDTNE